MRRPQVRFTLRSMMLAIAVLAVAFACSTYWWNQPTALDPFDTLEMLGPPSPAQHPGPSAGQEPIVGVNINTITDRLEPNKHARNATSEK